MEAAGAVAKASKAENSIKPAKMAGAGTAQGAERAASRTAAENNAKGFAAGGAAEEKNSKDQTAEAPAEETSEFTQGDNTKKRGFKIPAGLKAAAPMLLAVGAVLALIVFLVSLPMMLIGAIDYNLQKALGFLETVGILEKQGEYVTAEMAMNGEVPSEYASDLSEHGIDVGQVVANGDFYKTNVYIANIEERDGLVAAASGFSYISEDEGELALLYNGEIIKAQDFVARVESDPKLYAAYSGAANLSAKYYYGTDASEAFEDMGLSRGVFNSLELTGNYKTDEANFVATLNGFLDSDSDLGVGGRLEDEEEKEQDGVEPWDHDVDNGDNGNGGGTWSEEATDEGTTSTTSDNTMEYIVGWSIHDAEKCDSNGANCRTVKKFGPDFSDNATERATELLNSAVSSSEPYQAANVFMAIEEPIQRARIGDNGPVNILMNTISKTSTVSYQNVQTGEMESKTTSVLESTNFQAAVGEKYYSVDEAANFATDRALLMAGMEENDKIDEVIENTVVSSTGHPYSTSVSRNGKCWFFMSEEECEENKAEEDIVSGVNQTLNEVIVEENSNVFQSVIGANRLVQGGSYVSNSVNRKALGAMPSDSASIAKYNEVVDETLARKAEADRASLSPFDISSPNTFLGNIVHHLATTALGLYSYDSGVSLSALAASATDGAIATITGSVSAEGANQDFTDMIGSNCKTVNMTSTEGNLYCNSVNTNNTDYMNYTLEDWRGTLIGESIDEEGNIIAGSALEQFVTMGMDRMSTVGSKNAEVCERYVGYNGKSFFDSLLSVLSMYDACKGVDDNFATGAVYTRGPEGGSEEVDVELFTAYMLYSQVRALMKGETSSVAQVRERYYGEHPKDNSEAGMIARISGMTKSEAEIALAYNEYLYEIAHYDSSDRYQFRDVVGQVSGRSTLEYHSNKIAGDFVGWYTKESEFSDLRNRNFVA